MAFVGQSNCTAGGERWKTHAPKTVVPGLHRGAYTGGQHWAESLKGLTAGGQVGGLDALAANLIWE